jgi:hypothetical protein
MKKSFVVAALLAVPVLYGAGFLAANNSRVPAAGMVAAVPAVVEPPIVASGSGGGQAENGMPSAPLQEAALAFPSAALASLRYRDVREPASLTAEELARIYELDGLPQADGHLLMNHRTRVIVEDLVLALPRDVIMRSRAHLADAVALHAGGQVAAEFSGVLADYLRYRDALAAIDAERNARGAIPGDAGEDAALKQRLQDEAFGSENAAGLFRTERATLAVMAAHAARARMDTKSLAPAAAARMAAAYRAATVAEPHP